MDVVGVLPGEQENYHAANAGPEPARNLALARAAVLARALNGKKW
jgi:hypothetical protein